MFFFSCFIQILFHLTLISEIIYLGFFAFVGLHGLSPTCGESFMTTDGSVISSYLRFFTAPAASVPQSSSNVRIYGQRRKEAAKRSSVSSGNKPKASSHRQRLASKSLQEEKYGDVRRVSDLIDRSSQVKKVGQVFIQFCQSWSFSPEGSLLYEREDDCLVAQSAVNNFSIHPMTIFSPECLNGKP